MFWSKNKVVSPGEGVAGKGGVLRTGGSGRNVRLGGCKRLEVMLKPAGKRAAVCRGEEGDFKNKAAQVQSHRPLARFGNV